MKLENKVKREIEKNPKISWAYLKTEYNITDKIIRTIIKSINNVVDNSLDKISKVYNKNVEDNSYQKKIIKAKERGFKLIWKPKAQKVISGHIVNTKLVGLVGTLPHEEWTIELLISSLIIGMSYLGVCNVPSTYEIMKQTLKCLPLQGKTHLGDISQILYGVVSNTYAHLILDYCGFLSTVKSEVEYTLNNDLVQLHGIIAITVQKCREQFLGLPLNNKDKRCNAEKGIEAYFNNIVGKNYIVKEFFYYQDKGSKPMALIIIQRIR